MKYNLNQETDDSLLEKYHSLFEKFGYYKVPKSGKESLDKLLLRKLNKNTGRRDQ